MANMTEKTFQTAIRGILRSQKDIDECIAANPGKNYEEVLERAVALADAKRVVRKVTKDSRERQEVSSLRRKVQDQDWADLLVQARAVVLCGLPYKPTNKRQIVKTTRLGNGKELTVVFTAVGKHPLPYGKDRAVLALVTTLASRNSNPKVTFQSAMDFLQRLDLNTSGRDYAFLRGSLDRLKAFHCHISAGDSEREATGNRAVVLDAVIPSRNDAKMEALGTQMLVNHSSNNFFVELDPTFFREIKDHGVPIPLEVLRRYTNNPIAFDFITFLNYRIRVAKNPSRIPLSTLCEMLGTDPGEDRKDANDRKMKMRLQRVLQELREIWPECPAKFEGSGKKTVLYVAPPKDGKYLVMDREQRAALGSRRHQSEQDTLEGEALDTARDGS